MRKIRIKVRTGLALFMLSAFGLYAAGSNPPPPAANKTVHVRQYTRKDGTVVHSYTRAAPGSRSVTPSHARQANRLGNATSIRERNAGSDSSELRWPEASAGQQS